MMEKIKLKKLDIYSPKFFNKKLIKNENSDFDIDNYLHFPILIEKDGSLWKEANLYLLSKLKEYKKPSPKTLSSIADDLKNFKEWCELESIDFLKAPRKVQTPTYQYRSYLQELLRTGGMTPIK